MSLDHRRACAEARRKKIDHATEALKEWLKVGSYGLDQEAMLTELERRVLKFRSDVDQAGCDAVATSVAETPVSMRLLSDVVFYINDQSKEFRQCACHHSRHNSGAEAVAYRAAEILTRIAAYIEAAKAAM